MELRADLLDQPVHDLQAETSGFLRVEALGQADTCIGHRDSHLAVRLGRELDADLARSLGIGVFERVRRELVGGKR